MSQLNKAKQRIMQKGICINEAPQQDIQFKAFTKSSNLLSIPKLQIHKQRLTNQGEVSQYDLNSPILVKGNSPQFAKTQRSNLLHRSDRIQVMSQKAENGNLFKNKGAKTRRTAEYSKTAGCNLQPPDLSFTDNGRSVTNETPPKTIRSSVHDDHQKFIISKPAVRIALSPLKPLQCCLQNIDKIIDSQKQKTTSFTDDMFPPKFTIVLNKKYTCIQEGFKMERLTKIYQGLQLFIVKNCQPTLLQLGKYTSISLYCALTILCEEPTRVLTLLGNQQYNRNGAYYVQLCKDGVWRYILIDDYMPVKIMDKRNLLFLHCLPKNGNFEFWPCIIEKAIAKVYGTYQDVCFTADRGVKDLLLLLTGFPVSQYRINKDFRTFLILIDTAIKKNQIVVLEEICEEEKETAQEKDLYTDQSYQIIEVKKSYIVVRNLAAKQLSTRLSFEEAMIFSKLMIFRSQNNYVYISRTLRHKKGCYSVIRVKIKSSIKCYWQIWQNSEVYYKNHVGSPIQYKKSYFTIQIKKQSNDEQQTYDSNVNEQFISESGKEIVMAPGNYELRIHLCQGREQDFTLSFYGEEEVELVRVKNKQKWLHQCSC